MSQLTVGFNPATIELKDVVRLGMASDTKTLNDLANMLQDPNKRNQQYKKTIYPLFDTIALNTAGAAISPADFSFFTSESNTPSITNVNENNSVPEGQVWLVYGLSWGLIGLSRTTNAGTIDRINFMDKAKGTVTVTMKNSSIIPLSGIPFEMIHCIQNYSGFVSQAVTTVGPSGSAAVVQYVDSLNMSPDAPSQNISPELLLGKNKYSVKVHFEDTTDTFTNVLNLRLYLHAVIWTAM